MNLKLEQFMKDKDKLEEQCKKPMIKHQSLLERHKEEVIKVWMCESKEEEQQR